MQQTHKTEYHQVNNFRGYMAVSWDTFHQISPFTMKNHYKMMELTRDAPVTADKPQWIKDLPEGEGAPCIEWSSYLIVPDRPNPVSEEE